MLNDRQMHAAPLARPQRDDPAVLKGDLAPTFAAARATMACRSPEARRPTTLAEEELTLRSRLAGSHHNLGPDLGHPERGDTSAECPVPNC